MTQPSTPSSSSPSSPSSPSAGGPTGRPEPSPDRTRGAQMMVAGMTVAVLAPLLGFLTGSMIGPSQQVGDFDAMFVALFIGIFVGGIGAVVGGLGLLKFARNDAQEPWQF